MFATTVLFLPLCLHVFHVVQWSLGMRRPLDPALPTPLKNDSQLKLSVVLPVRNEADTLPLLLADLAAQTHLPHDVVVVDDASDDGTIEAAQSAGPWPFPLRVMPNPGQGKKAGLSAGLHSATSEWAVGVDADTRIGPHALSAMAQGIECQAQSKDLLLLPLRLATESEAPPQTGFHRLQALDFAAMQGWAVSAVRQGRPAMASGGGWIWRVAAFPHGELKPHIPSGDDVFALAALIERGDQHRVGWLGNPDAMVSAAPMYTLSSLVDQRIRWGAKATQYPKALKSARRVALSISAMHLTGLLLLLMNPLWGLVFWGIKSGVDMAYAHQVGRIYSLFKVNRKSILGTLLSLAIVHPLFIATTLILMPFRNVQWKGRSAL